MIGAPRWPCNDLARAGHGLEAQVRGHDRAPKNDLAGVVSGCNADTELHAEGKFVNVRCDRRVAVTVRHQRGNTSPPTSSQCTEVFPRLGDRRGGCARMIVEMMRVEMMAVEIKVRRDHR
jgi:hypothetical protein